MGNFWCYRHKHECPGNHIPTTPEDLDAYAESIVESTPWASPPRCAAHNEWMVPDEEIGDDGTLTGRALYVCPTCCLAVDRDPNWRAAFVKEGGAP